MIPKSATPLACAALAVLCLTGCGKKNQPADTGAASPAEALLEVCGEVFRDVDFSAWMSRAELEQFQRQTVDGQYFAHVQGRCRLGLNEYRALVRPFPSNEASQSAVHWGLTEAAAYEVERDLLRRGYKRHSLQLFRSASGEVLHQMVWLKPIDGQAHEAAPHPPGNKRQVPPAESTPTLAAETEPSAAPSLPATDDSVPAAGDEAMAPPQALPVVQSPAEDDSPPPPQAGPADRVAIPAAPPHETAAAEPEPVPAAPAIYQVVKGDSLAKIARQHQVSVQALKEINQLKSNDLQIGQQLRIPAR